MGTVIAGLGLWLVIYMMARGLQRRSRRAVAGGRAGASPSTVSRNPSRMTGPKWEQDAPYPECFDDLNADLYNDLEDDL